MKLKYYLRGLGIGIAVTAMILNFSGKQNTNELTDAEIKKRAMELGMVEKSLLSDVLTDTQEGKMESSTEESETSEEATSEEVTSKEIASETQSEQDKANEEIASETQSEQDRVNEEVIGEKQSETKNSEESTVVEPETSTLVSNDEEKKQFEIVVNSGESSVSISKKLEIAGLVDSAKEFDRFLCQNGYDKKICTGKHIISSGASKDEIAKIITSR